MPRLNVDTSAEIRAVALELFASRGFEQTSLREIAERLGITKAALYYHYSSKDELLGSLIDPLVVDLRAFIDVAADLDRQQIVEGYFDLCHRHRMIFSGLLHDVRVLTRLDVDTLVHWRSRLDDILLAGGPGNGVTVADRVRAVVALGGVQDCVIMFPDVAVDEIRGPAVDAALRALSVG